MSGQLDHDLQLMFSWPHIRRMLECRGYDVSSWPMSLTADYCRKVLAPCEYRLIVRLRPKKDPPSALFTKDVNDKPPKKLTEMNNKTRKKLMKMEKREKREKKEKDRKRKRGMDKKYDVSEPCPYASELLGLQFLLTDKVRVHAVRDIANWANNFVDPNKPSVATIDKPIMESAEPIVPVEQPTVVGPKKDVHTISTDINTINNIVHDGVKDIVNDVVEENVKGNIHDTDEGDLVKDVVKDVVKDGVCDKKESETEKGLEQGTKEELVETPGTFCCPFTSAKAKEKEKEKAKKPDPKKQKKEQGFSTITSTTATTRKHQKNPGLNHVIIFAGIGATATTLAEIRSMLPKLRIEVHRYERHRFSVLDHQLVPPLKILSPAELRQWMDRHHVRRPSQLSVQALDDAVSEYYGLPVGAAVMYYCSVGLAEPVEHPRIVSDRISIHD